MLVQDGENCLTVGNIPREAYKNTRHLIRLVVQKIARNKAIFNWSELLLLGGILFAI